MFNIYLTIKHLLLTAAYSFGLLFIFWINPPLIAQNDLYYKDYLTNKSEAQRFRLLAENEVYYSNDTSIDLKHYHLSLWPEVYGNKLEGVVEYRVQSKVDSLQAFFLDLAPEFKVIGKSWNIKSALLGGRQLRIILNEKYNLGETFEFWLAYEGEPKLLNNTKGLHFRNTDPENPLIVSLSTPYLAHQWWPCKDGPEDKADSILVDIYIPKETPGGKKLIAVSNGTLEGMEEDYDLNEIRFRWKHRYPIVPYYVMMAIAPYSLITDNYVNEIGDSIHLDYYVFEDHVEAAISGTEAMPQVLEFFESVFGPYPFSIEKYGMTQLGFYGGIENQTNSVVNRMSSDYFWVLVHELAHMWFGDMITCANWNDAWLNEGFASYAECLWAEELYGQEGYRQCIQGKKYLQGGSLYLENVNDPFGVFLTIIYHKGSWVLHMLRGIMGDEIFFNCLYNYANAPELVYKNANSKDLQNIFERESNLNLEAFFQSWLYGSYYPVYHYNYEQSNEEELKFYLKQEQESSLGSTTVFEMPIELLLVFEDGGDSLVIIENKKLYQEFSIQVSQAISMIELDPNNWILCEKTRDFSVGTSTPDANDLEGLIFPNPVLIGQSINIENHASNPIRTIKIWDNQSRLLKTLTPHVQAPNQLIKIDSGLLKQARYYIELIYLDGRSSINPLIVNAP